MKMKDLVERGIFSHFELAFAQYVSKGICEEHEDILLCLAFLCICVQQGYSCLKVIKKRCFPEISQVIPFEQIAECYNEITSAIIRGFHRMPPSIVARVNHLELLIDKPLCRYKNQIYLHSTWIYETKILLHINRLKDQRPACLWNEKIFLQLLQEIPELTDLQRKTIQNAFFSNFLLICGGPGTGKTYTISLLIELLIRSFDPTKKEQFVIAIAAPTGKAASLLRTKVQQRFPFPSYVQFSASTLHSLLKIHRDFEKSEGLSFLDADLIIVDEASMIEKRILSLLLERTGNRTKIILAGDAHQLPSIEGGSLFAEMVDSFQKDLVCVLDKNFRFESGKIQKFTTKIKEGSISDLSYFEEETDDTLQLSLRDDKWNEEILSAVEKYYLPFQNSPIDPKVALYRIQQFCLLSSLRYSSFGVEALNQKILNHFLAKSQKNQWLTVPIIVTRNDPRNDLYNGMIGICISCRRYQEFRMLPHDEVFFLDGRSFPLFILPSYEMAYCLSVHKSQGSEFERILLVLPEGSEIFGRELLYTAATRAKSYFHLLTTKKTLHACIRRRSLLQSSIAERFSSL